MVSYIFQIKKIQLTLTITLTLIDTVMVIIYVLSPVPVTDTQAIQPPVPAAGTVVSVCRYAKVPAAGTVGCTACVPVTGTGDRTKACIKINIKNAYTNRTNSQHRKKQ